MYTKMYYLEFQSPELSSSHFLFESRIQDIQKSGTKLEFESRYRRRKTEESSRAEVFQSDAAREIDEISELRGGCGLMTATGNCGGSEPVGGARRRVQRVSIFKQPR